MVTWFNASWYQSQRCGLLSMVWILTCSWWISLLTSDHTKLNQRWPQISIAIHYMHILPLCYIVLILAMTRSSESLGSCVSCVTMVSIIGASVARCDAEHLRRKTIKGIYLKRILLSQSPANKKTWGQQKHKDSQRFSLISGGDRRPKIDSERHLPRRAWCTLRQWHLHKSWNEGIVLVVEATNSHNGNSHGGTWYIHLHEWLIFMVFM